MDDSSVRPTRIVPAAVIASIREGVSAAAAAASSAESIHAVAARPGSRRKRVRIIRFSSPGREAHVPLADGEPAPPRQMVDKNATRKSAGAVWAGCSGCRSAFLLSLIDGHVLAGHASGRMTSIFLHGNAFRAFTRQSEHRSPPCPGPGHPADSSRCCAAGEILARTYRRPDFAWHRAKAVPGLAAAHPPYGCGTPPSATTAPRRITSPTRGDLSAAGQRRPGRHTRHLVPDQPRIEPAARQ